MMARADVVGALNLAVGVATLTSVGVIAWAALKSVKPQRRSKIEHPPVSAPAELRLIKGGS